MKPPAGHKRARQPAPRKPVQLNLRRAAPATDEDEREDQPSNFWRWFALVFFIHVLGFIILMLVFRSRPVPPPMEISWVPVGDVAKGTPGPQAAAKIGPSTPAPSHHHAAPTPEPVEPAPPKPQPAKPKIHHVAPAPVKPLPILKADAPVVAPAPVKPPTPVKPKVKVDLHLADAPDTDTPKPVIKPKPRLKKMVRPPDDSPDQADTSRPDTDGLSKEEVAAKLGSKLKAAGVEKGVKSGPSGATNGRANSYADFYAALRDQVMNKWAIPNLTDAAATDPVVRIHVEKNGRVPPGSVTLERSSNNPVYDESALAAARSIGYTLQPLPDGCPPDISITFKPNQ